MHMRIQALRRVVTQLSHYRTPMVIDSSALLAIALGEPDAAQYIEAIAGALENNLPAYVPASVLVEAGITADQRNCGAEFDTLVDRIQPEIVPLDASMAELARKAFRRFGRGRHRASLNVGDCMTYATAQYLQLPLLYKGEDFRETDMESALKKDGL